MMMSVTCCYLQAHLSSHCLNEAANFFNWTELMFHLCLIYGLRCITLIRYVIDTPYLVLQRKWNFLKGLGLIVCHPAKRVFPCTLCSLKLYVELCESVGVPTILIVSFSGM